MGAELFHRSNKGLTLTNTGKTYFQECAGFIKELNTRITNLHNSINSPSGSLTVVAPINIGSGPLDEFWKQFVARHPQIALNVQLVDPLEDLATCQADIGIQSGERRNSALVQKRIGSITPVLVAAPELAGMLPQQIEELQTCPSIATELFSDWVLLNGTEEVRIRKQHQHTSNEMSVTLSLVKAGAGVALLPLSMVHADIEQGRLVHLLPQWSGKPRLIYLIWPYQRTLSIRAKLFQEELLEFLGTQQWFSASSPMEHF